MPPTPVQAVLPATLEEEGLFEALCVEFRICELVELPELGPTAALDEVPLTPALTGLPKLSCTEFSGAAELPALPPLVWLPAELAEVEGLLSTLGEEVDA